MHSVASLSISETVANQFLDNNNMNKCSLHKIILTIVKQKTLRWKWNNEKGQTSCSSLAFVAL